MASKLACAAKTDVGLKRTNNEDNFAVVQSAGLYVLADGMGGHASGQVASTMCVSHVAQYICELSRQPGFKLSFPTKPEWSFEAKLLANAIMYANERVFIQSCKDRSMEGMGTTVTAIFNAPRGLVLAHVGDSRIYRVRKGEIAQMTRDHSLLNHLIDKGELRPEDAANFANKNVILRAIGLKDEVEVDIKEVPREKGDIYMMCSDGLSDLVADALICKTISEAKSLDDACASLIGLALKAGGKDNVTVVCVSVEEDDDAQQPKPQTIAPQSANMAGGMPPAMMNGPMGAAQATGRPMAVNPNPMPAQGFGQPPMGVMASPMNMMPGAQPPGSRPSMVAMPGARRAVPVPAHLQQTAPAPAAPQRMHSVREIVETKPAQRSMPKPIGSAGRSNSGGMPAVMQPARVKPVSAPETPPPADSVKGNSPIAPELPGKSGDGGDLKQNASSAAAPKEIDASAKQDKRELPETNLLFTAPPQSAPQAPAADAGDLGGFANEEDNGLFSSDASRYADGGDGENSDVKTVIECPIISDDLLHAPPKSLNIPSAASASAPKRQIPKPAQPAAGSSASQTGLKPTAGISPFKAKLDNDLATMPAQNGASQSAIYECDDDDGDSIVISRPISNRYMPPKGVIEPPKDFGDDDSIEISPDLYDDDEDSVTKTFKPTFKKW